MPALANTFLFVEPQQHYLEYASKVLHDLIASNRKAGQTIVELIGTDANAAKVSQTLQSLSPIVFAGCGHGNYTTYTVECTELFMRVGDDKVPLMKDRVVQLNSCQTAAELGPAIKSAGALAFVGSNESFWFYTGQAANSTRAVRSPFLAEWQFVVSLLQGKTIEQSRTDQMATYESELSYWVEGDGRTNPDAADIARIININKSISTYIGNGSGSTTPSPSGTGGATGGMALPPVVTVTAVSLGAFALFWYLLEKA